MTWRRSLALLGVSVALVQLTAFYGSVRALESGGASMEAMVAKMDQVEYLRLADTMLTDRRFALAPDASAEVFRTPGYPAFVAFSYILSGHWYWAPFFASALLVGLLAAFVALLAASLGLSRSMSLASGALMGFSSGSFLLITTATGSDVLYTLVYALAVLCAVRTEDGTRRSIAVGVLLGLATLVRPIGILASLPLLFGHGLIRNDTWRGYARGCVIAFAAWALMLAPWYVRNAAVTGTPLLSTVSTFNVVYYNIPMNEAFWNNVPEETARLDLMERIGSTSVDALRGAAYVDGMEHEAQHYLSTHAIQYGIFHLYRTTPFFLASGFNVINAVLAHEAPALHIPLFPTESENLTHAISEHRWHDVLFALSRYWFTSLERLGWLLAIGAAFAAPLLSSGRERRVLLLFAVIIIANIILVSPVTQARYRFPAEPFIWAAAVYTGATLWNRYRHPRT